MTFAMPSPIAVSRARTPTAESAAQSKDPSSQASRPDAPTPLPSAIPPATSHRTGQERFWMSRPPMTRNASSATTGTKPTMLDDTPWSGSVIHRRIVSPAIA